MRKFDLAENLYIYPTPGGAFHASSVGGDDPARRLLRALLQIDKTPQLSLDGLQEWTGLADADQALNLLHHTQKLSWVQGLDAPLRCSTMPLEDVLPGLLAKLSDDKKVLLSDSHGFYLAAQGFPHEVAEELSALSAELTSLNERRSGLLLNNLGLHSSGWSLTDAAGCSQLGFWPLLIGAHRFVLVISGLPRLNRPEFVELIWILSLRYAVTALH